jgi:succinate dehydrogenase/fumarate reductase cytochrome b subunit
MTDRHRISESFWSQLQRITVVTLIFYISLTAMLLVDYLIAGNRSVSGIFMFSTALSLTLYIPAVLILVLSETTEGTVKRQP